ncbi:MAG: PA0069 family radical SAM protein [Phycisphaerae bacterium]|nr:PA0069 family radical SAM protein [Phycisphaerae bacterium]NNF42785.1 PA0069 family radical SAM protein [Phycisphaerales bacterium]
MDREYSDALPGGVARGRGAGLNPGNRFEGERGLRLHVLGEHLDAVTAESPDGRQVRTEVFDDSTRRLINRVDSPDLPFHWTINPYRGCEHGCVYCYARPTHEMLGLSCGLDFETKIIAKPDAPELLRRELAASQWRGEPIAMSGVTDAYQPLERRLRITRRCLEIMAECRQPVTIVTKNRLVERDIDLLTTLAAADATRVAVSLTTLDATLAARLEPRASAPRDRLHAIRTLADAGVPVLAMIAPIIPGLTDQEVPALLAAAAKAGASSASWVMLRLPHQVKALFFDWLARHAPDRAARVEAAIRSTRGGALTESRFGARMRGHGAHAEHIKRTFEVFAKRAGLSRDVPALSSSAFRRPEMGGQMRLFG